MSATCWTKPLRGGARLDCKAVGSGEKALVYLGRYPYRGVIREQDIAACVDGQVSFRYRAAKTGKLERRTVPGAQFLWLVLQHVLSKGFRRARNYGFVHPNRRQLIALLRVLLKRAAPPAAPPAATAVDALPVLQRGHGGHQDTDSHAPHRRQHNRCTGHVSKSLLR
ncbi:transposase [Pseudomonas stutzeri]|nr:transposase [Stutzerimonas stutzeri]